MLLHPPHTTRRKRIGRFREGVSNFPCDSFRVFRIGTVLYALKPHSKIQERRPEHCWYGAARHRAPIRHHEAGGPT